jgi:hypothetical protein
MRPWRTPLNANVAFVIRAECDITDGDSARDI